jgi:hypothetical protein
VLTAGGTTGETFRLAAHSLAAWAWLYLNVFGSLAFNAYGAFGRGVGMDLRERELQNLW